MVTVLSTEAAGAEALLALVRGREGIGNRLHRVRDGTLGDAACRVHPGHALRIFAPEETGPRPRDVAGRDGCGAFAAPDARARVRPHALR